MSSVRNCPLGTTFDGEIMADVLVIAPHPDDETIGCGGTLLLHVSKGDAIHWVIVTKMDLSLGFTSERIDLRQKEIDAVEKRYGFASVHQLNFPTTCLDEIPIRKIIEPLSDVIQGIRPSTVYLPYDGDAHSDHRLVFDAAAAVTKSFRSPFLRRILAYETLSETDFNISPIRQEFRPNVFSDISLTLDEKISIMEIYASELQAFPFPRSDKAIRALAAVRGATAGCEAAEGFILLRELI
jgi:LmbE family N-acetylglucosaminyl deacetylase